MKKLFVLSMLLLSACGHAVLTRSSNVYKHNVNGHEVVCSVVNEWNVSDLRKDKKEKGCWCLLSGDGLFPVPTMLFFLAKDSACTDKPVQVGPDATGEEDRL